MLILAETDISVSCVGKGQFIRWYLNGWHYLFLEQGSESQVVEGTEALPSSYSRLALQAYGLKEGDLRAAKTVAFASSLDLLTVDGWKNAILESGSVETKRTGASLYPISLTVNVFGKVADYSPVAEVVPPIALSDIEVLRQIRAESSPGDMDAVLSDDKDPYTEWWDGDNEWGVLWGNNPFLDFIAQITGIQIPNIADRDPHKCYGIHFSYANIPKLRGDFSELSNLTILASFATSTIEATIGDCPPLKVLALQDNLLGVIGVANRLNIEKANFNNNKLLPAEVTRLLGIGFTAQEIGAQNP